MWMRGTALLLTMAVLACGSDGAGDADVAPPPAATSTAPVSGAAADVRLTRASFERWMSAVEALMIAAQSDPAVARDVEVDGDESAEQAAARLRANPRIASVLRDNGFTPEQYVGMMMNMIGAMFAQGALEAGQITELPAEVNEADVQFIADNKEWIQERWERIQALAPEGSNDDDYDAGEDEGR